MPSDPTKKPLSKTVSEPKQLEDQIPERAYQLYEERGREDGHDAEFRRKNSPFYGPERFTYQPEHNRYICPAGQPLNYGGRVHRNRAFNYIGTRKRCGACLQKAQCTSAPFRSLIIHQCESARQRARELAKTEESAKAQLQRKKVEALFAELKIKSGCVVCVCGD